MGMADEDRAGHTDRSREDYGHGLPDYHDPTGGVGGASPALSPLTARIWLAAFGVLVCTGGAILIYVVTPLLWFAIALMVLAAITLVDLGWVSYRKWRGEPG